MDIGIIYSAPPFNDHGGISALWFLIMSRE